MHKIELKKIENETIDLCLTDPPYFLDKMDHKWDNAKLDKRTKSQTIKHLSGGMKFSKEQGIQLYNWFLEVSKEIHRVLKPGGFFFSFSYPRLFHRMVCSMEDAGFEIRDLLAWIYTLSLPKAMSLNHFVKNNKVMNEEEKIRFTEEIKNLKTPMLKNCFEPICVAQKCIEGTYIENFRKYKTGLINVSVKIGNNKFPSNVISTEEIFEVLDSFFLIEKPNKKEKGDFNKHKTVKPINICKYIISLTTTKNAIVLDPFCGSGTTLVASKILGRNFIGIDINEENLEITKKRIENYLQKSKNLV